MIENWMEVGEAIAQYGRQIINGCTVKHDRSTGIIYVDVNSDRKTIEANVLYQAQKRVQSQEKPHD